jgi:4-amino-4-deoxy-L-arabinose transferase-like glycosyltransferase
VTRAARGTSRAVLLSLLLIAVAAVLRGVAWSAALPPWQGPDEPAHYAYVERLAGGGFPPLQRDNERDSPALVASLDASAFWRFRLREPTRPLSPGIRAALPEEPRGLSEDGRGAGGATPYPPAYYALAVPLYLLPGLDTATARLYAVRALSALLAGALVVMTFLLVREVTGRPGPALAGGLLVALPPIVGQASAIVNPDLLLATAAAGLAWALLRRAPRPGTAARWLHVSAWFALTALAKPVGLAVAVSTTATLLLVPAVASRRVAALVASGFGVAGAAAAVLPLVGGERIRGPYAFGARYLRDFYAPNATFSDGTPPPAWSVWVESGVAGFGWHTVWLPGGVYVLAAVSLVFVAGAALSGVVRERSRLPLVAALAVSVAVYLATMHAAELVVVLRGGERLLQGRYLIPVVPIGVAAFVAAVDGLRPRAAAVVVTGVCAIWGFIAFAGLDAVVRFFAS